MKIGEPNNEVIAPTGISFAKDLEIVSAISRKIAPSTAEAGTTLEGTLVESIILALCGATRPTNPIKPLMLTALADKQVAIKAIINFLAEMFKPIFFAIESSRLSISKLLKMQRVPKSPTPIIAPHNKSRLHSIEFKLPINHCNAVCILESSLPSNKID